MREREKLHHQSRHEELDFKRKFGEFRPTNNPYYERAAHFTRGSMTSRKGTEPGLGTGLGTFMSGKQQTLRGVSIHSRTCAQTPKSTKYGG